MIGRYTDTEKKFIIAIGELLDESNRPSVNPHMISTRTGN